MIASFSDLGVDLPSIYCLDSSPQFCRICLVIQRLHFCILCSFVNLVISSFISGREGDVVSGSEIISCSIMVDCVEYDFFRLILFDNNVTLVKRAGLYNNL